MYPSNPMVSCKIHETRLLWKPGFFFMTGQHHRFDSVFHNGRFLTFLLGSSAIFEPRPVSSWQVFVQVRFTID
jgi:hypothetical protein